MNIVSILLNVSLVLCSVFLICLVLIQRGKGGGLAGAFGGVGGSSAFGTKAGDVFTRVTIIVAGVWIVLNMLLVILSNRGTDEWIDDEFPEAGARQVAPTTPGPGGTGSVAPGAGTVGTPPPGGAVPAGPSAPVGGQAPVAPTPAPVPAPAPTGANP